MHMLCMSMWLFSASWKVTQYGMVLTEVFWLVVGKNLKLVDARTRTRVSCVVTTRTPSKPENSSPIPWRYTWCDVMTSNLESTKNAQQSGNVTQYMNVFIFQSCWHASWKPQHLHLCIAQMFSADYSHYTSYLNWKQLTFFMHAICMECWHEW